MFTGTRKNHPRRAAGAGVTVGVVVMALVAGGCSSSPTGSGAKNKASVTTDLALARHGLIVLGDLPSGWTASGKVTAGSSSGDNVPISKIASCLGVDKAEIKSTWPTENSPLFNRQADGSTIGDEVETFPSAGRTRTDYSTFSNPKTPGCITSIFGPLLREDAQKGGGPGTSVGAIATTREPFPAVGDQSGEIEIVAPFSTSGVKTTLYVDLVDIIVGRLETTLSFTTVGSPFDQTVAGQVARAAVRHMSENPPLS